MTERLHLRHRPRNPRDGLPWVVETGRKVIARYKSFDMAHGDIVWWTEHNQFGIPNDQRRLEFEHLVLRGIWVLLWALVLKPRSRSLSGIWREDALGYLDKHGRQGESPKEYRRVSSFPELPQEET